MGNTATNPQSAKPATGMGPMAAATQMPPSSVMQPTAQGNAAVPGQPASNMLRNLNPVNKSPTGSPSLGATPSLGAPKQMAGK